MTWLDDMHLPYARVIGRFVSVNVDGPDEDLYPDIVPLNGTITFTATTIAGTYSDALTWLRPIEALVFDGEIVSGTEESGYESGIRLTATDVNLGVSEWAWTATFDIAGIPLDPYTFRAPRDSTVNITSGALSIKSQPVRIIEGASIVDAEADTENGLLRFVLSDGQKTDWIDVPNGKQGIQGPPGDQGEPGKDGASPSLSIGQVSQGQVAEAYITGEAPQQQLNLVLPRGERGPAPVVTWDESRIIVDDIPGPDLRGATGAIDATMPEPGVLVIGSQANPGLDWRPITAADGLQSTAEVAVRPDGEMLFRGALYRLNGDFESGVIVEIGTLPEEIVANVQTLQTIRDAAGNDVTVILYADDRTVRVLTAAETGRVELGTLRTWTDYRP